MTSEPALQGRPRITLSVVSHRQGHLVRELLETLETIRDESVEVVITLNVPETLPFAAAQFGFPVRILDNVRPRGFGANHNSAFRSAQGEFLCVINPDISFTVDPFAELVAALRDGSTGVAAPQVVTPLGAPEDNGRTFPTPAAILKKAFLPAPRRVHPDAARVSHPDWVAGMFMLLSRKAFEAVGGFDERYFLYYEDVDLCARLRLHGFQVAYCPRVSVVHAAQRRSHRNPYYFVWHLQSMVRFFCSDAYRRVRQA